MTIKKTDLYSSLWASCDQLRGGMDASQYKDYVLFMLFIKYISDKYANGGPFALVVIPQGASFRDMVALTGKADIGDKINTQIIAPLIAANDRLSPGDFPDFNDPNKLGDDKERVEKLSNLIAIFENPALNFSGNHAENDDILGDAYEYLMRHFASESGKSKGQFYTPSEVSRVIAKVIGIGQAQANARTTAYDPTCGSGSLLLKVAAEAGTSITLEGQEKDVTTAGLARMNMILHNFPTATIATGNTLTGPKFKDGPHLRTYDYVVANPPFSDKAWRTGLTPSNDEHQRFAWGEPPAKQGDYAYLLHIIRSMKANGKGACILPHGVLFRGNAEADIRRHLVRSGILKGIIGLPANLFYGTGIPACILVLDKENATARKGIFMMDASKGYIKDGNKNRLREQDVHKIVDVFTRLDSSNPRYARMVGLAEIESHDFNLNLPRYIDNTDPEDLQDIDAHLCGGIPERDLDALAPYWQVLPSVRASLFQPLRPHYARLNVPLSQVKADVLAHPEFVGFQSAASARFAQWQADSTALLKAFEQHHRPKDLIHRLSEDLLLAFATTPLVDAYDIYEHLMDYWAASLQDDAYLIAAVGWQAGAQPRELHKQKGKDDKQVWTEPHDYLVGKRRFKSDLVPAALLVARYFATEQTAIDALHAQLAQVTQHLQELEEEHTGEDGLLLDVLDDKGKITAKSIKARQKNPQAQPLDAEEAAVLSAYLKGLTEEDRLKKALKTAETALNDAIAARYPRLTLDDIKTLVVDDKWMGHLHATVQAELDRVTQTLTQRIQQLAQRYATPLPTLTAEVTRLQTLVNRHLSQMGHA